MSSEESNKKEESTQSTQVEEDDIDDEDFDEDGIDPYKIYRDAYALMKTGLFLESFPKFEKAFDLARGLNQMKLFETAISDFSKELESSGCEKPSYYHCFRAMAQSNLNKYEDALKDLDLAIEKEDEDIIKGGYHFHRGLIRNKMKMLKGAVEDFSMAMNLDPDGSSNAIVFRFLVNYKLGDESEMKKDYDLIKEMDNVPDQFKDDIKKIAERFNLDAAPTEEPTEAETSALSGGPSGHGDGTGHLSQPSPEAQPTASQQASGPQVPSLGHDFSEIPVSPEIEAEVNAMSNSEKLTVLKTELAKFEGMTKERDEEKIIGYLAQDMGRLTKLLDWFNKEAKNWKSKFENGRRLVNLKQYSEAITCLSECLEFEPNHTETYYLRAVSYYHLNTLPPALKDVIQAIKLDQTNHLFFSLLGYIYVSMGELKQALEVFHNAMERKPNNHEYYYICAMLYDNLNESDKCVAYINKAIELKPNHEPYMQFKLSQLLKQQDMMEKRISQEEKMATREEKDVHKKERKLRQEMQKQEDMEEPDDEDLSSEEELDLDKFRKGVEEDLEDFDFRKMEQLKLEMEKELEKKVKLEKELKEKEDLLRKVQMQKERIQNNLDVDDEDMEDDDDDDIEDLDLRELMEEKKKKKLAELAEMEEEEDDDDEEEEEEEEVKGAADESFEEVTRKAITKILRNGDEQIFKILKSLRLEEYFEGFQEKNIIWFDVVHGYLTNEDYAEVFPRIRFMRRFKTYVEKYVLIDKNDE